MSVKREEYIRYIQEYKQRHHGWAPNARQLINHFGLSFEEVGQLNAQCAEAGYPGLLGPLSPMYSWYGGTYTNPGSLYGALRHTEVEVDSISVEASSGKVTIILQREDNLVAFLINQGDIRESPHYYEEIIPLLAEKDRMVADVLSVAWSPDPK